MPSSPFQTTRRRKRPPAAEESSVAVMADAADFSPNWLITRLGFDPESFWKDPGNAHYLDTEVAVEAVSGAHADFAFPEMLGAWDDRDDHIDGGRAFLGRMIAVSLAQQPAWPVGRAWFHDLFTDLARLEGAIGIDLTSEKQMRHAVVSFWKRVGLLAKTHAHAISVSQPTPPVRPPRPDWMRRDEPTTPMKQLALF